MATQTEPKVGTEFRTLTVETVVRGIMRTLRDIPGDSVMVTHYARMMMFNIMDSEIGFGDNIRWMHKLYRDEDGTEHSYYPHTHQSIGAPSGCLIRRWVYNEEESQYESTTTLVTLMPEEDEWIECVHLPEDWWSEQ